MSEPVDLNELRLEASYAENALLDAYRNAEKFVAWVASGGGCGFAHDGHLADRDACWCHVCEAQRTLARMNALVTPEGDTDDT